MKAFFGDYIFGLALPVSLIGLGIFFLFYLKFFFILKPKKIFGGLFSGGGSEGFSALTVALAGTLGVGNISGVASALILGGPGAVFWMWVSAFAAMVLKYSEIVLAHSHRRFGKTGFVGGAMYYIEDFFSGAFGKLLAGLFALLCLLNSFSMGCMLQARAVSDSVREIYDISPITVGILLALICGIVILRGIYDISPLTRLIIPTMSVLYVIMASAVMIAFRSRLSYAFSLILRDAFSFKSTAGGVLGFFISGGLRYGCMRGILSNEAGCGTAPMAHAAADTKNPSEQGAWGIIEVFVDTILLCTMTAIPILIIFGDSLCNFSEGEEMKLVISSFASVFGVSSASLVTIMVFFFAFATIICWAYYGNVTLFYLTQSPRAEKLFKLGYIICVFVGAAFGGSFVWSIADFALTSMTFINLAVLFLMRHEIKEKTFSHEVSK